MSKDISRTNDSPVTETAAAGPGSELDEKRRLRGLVFLGLSIFALNLGIHVYMTTNVNFLHKYLQINSWQQGYLEAIRETCGILSFFAMGMLLARSEARLASLMMLITGAGLAAYYAIGTIPQVILCSLFWSFGFHLWLPMSSSMQLGLAARGHEGRTLGRLRSVGAAGSLVGLGGVWLLKNFADFDMRILFGVAGILTALGAIPCFFVPETRPSRASRMPLRRAFRPPYRLYCAIELLDGMRKQIFLLFAILVLVREYHVTFDVIALLMFVSQVLCLLLAPAAGWVVDRFGERPVMSVYFATIAVLFIAYATVTDLHKLYVVYVLDHAMFALRVAVPTYANRIAAPGERTQLLALGVTMNHVGAVTLPLIGGALYVSWGYQYPFYCGSAITLVSLAIVQWVQSRSSAIKTL